MLDAVRADVTARHDAKIVDLARIRRCQILDRQLESRLVFSCLSFEAQPGDSIGVEIIADIHAGVIASLSNTVLDRPCSVLEYFDLAGRRTVEFLAEHEAAGQGQPGDTQVIADGPGLGPV